jgi:hypothetical protein
MTVEKYQRIYEISQTTHDDIERVAWMICYLFEKSPDEVNNLSSIKFLKLSDKLSKQLQVKQPWYSYPKLQTDALKITFGQFIECNYWLKASPIEVAHLVSASLVLPNWIVKGDHQAKAQAILNLPIGFIFDQLNTFVESLNALIKSYSGLFEIDNEPKDEELINEPPHPFLDQYGWFFSAKQVADHEGITLEAAYELPVMQVLNDLSYLKAKAQYDKYLAKQ